MSFQDMRSKDDRERIRQPHAIWRGIGLAMIVLIPLVSIAIADQLIRYLWETMPGFTIPRGFLRTPLVIEQLNISIANFPAVVAIAIVIGIALFALFSFSPCTRRISFITIKSYNSAVSRSEYLARPLMIGTAKSIGIDHVSTGVNLQADCPFLTQDGSLGRL